MNGAEAAQLLGVPVTDRDQAVEAANQLRACGAEAAIVTLGAAGSVYAGPDGTLVANAPHVHRPMAVGAGDCFLAAIAVTLAGGRGITAGLGLAVAAASANTTTLTVADFTRADVDRELARVRIGH